ncbi:hypothetical protein PM082_006325 [Marasmius tenuissimus]|nr:hypothetical protein PM082_006325 [Marasmius tenuissimus]
MFSVHSSSRRSRDPNESDVGTETEWFISSEHNDPSSDDPYRDPHLHRPRRRLNLPAITTSCASVCGVHRPVRRILSFRRVLLLVVSVATIFVVFLLREGVPPTFEDVRQYERALPQHNRTDAWYDATLDPPGKRKYLRVEGTASGVGLNNVLQQLLHLSYLAHQSGRAFVFEDYTWSHLPFPYTIYDFKLRPTKLPMNTIVSGASSGGILSANGLNSQRSVSLEFFDAVCPPESRVILSAADAPSEAAAVSGVEIVDWWLRRLRDAENEQCVVIRATNNNQLFDWVYFGTELPLSVLPSLVLSPTITHFSWSPLVMSAVARNFALLRPSDPRTLLDTGVGTSSTLEGLVAVHLRRGDFAGHCRFLHSHRATFSAYNKHEKLPDRFYPSPLPDSDASRANYQEHCFPDIDQIVAKLDRVRQDNPPLRRVFLLSNGSRWWLSRLARKLQDHGWADIINTNDLYLDSAQKQVSGAVDMAIAEKAEVFVGNGFSTLSGNIILLRLAKGMKPESNRHL